MTHDQQRLSDYLAHILEAIERIDRYTEDMDELTFLDSQMAQDAVIRNVEIIGEASHNIEMHYPEFAADHPELPLAFAYRCATPWHMAILRWIWKLSGKRFTVIYRVCIRKSRQRCQPYRTTTVSKVRHTTSNNKSTIFAPLSMLDSTSRKPGRF